MADNKFFTNTYITGKGRQNYLKIKNLEDPLFTSFTFGLARSLLLRAFLWLRQAGATL